MSIKQAVLERTVQPVYIKVLQWRGDPLARMLRPSHVADPYPFYAELREGGPAPSKIGAWVVSRYDHVQAILRDPRCNHDLTRTKNHKPAVARAADDPLAIVPSDTEMLLTMDPPDHTRVRRLVGKAFSPRAIDALGPGIQQLADELVEAVAASGRMDVVDDLALPLPMSVICRMLGVPFDDRERFKRWGHAIGASLDIQLSSSAQERTEQVAAEVCRYLDDLIEDHRAHPRDDLLTELIAAEEEGDRLTHRELLGTCFLLLIAGFETTVSLIGSGMLLEHPDQLAGRVDDPGLIPGAVDELLRYDSPVQLTSRIATEAIDLGGGEGLPGGHEVIVLLGSANRDPAAFADPDRLDVTRAGANRHVSFSAGLHHCLGASLARMEAKAAFTSLFGRLEKVELDGDPVRRPFMVLRGLESLPVRFRPAA